MPQCRDVPAREMPLKFKLEPRYTSVGMLEPVVAQLAPDDVREMKSNDVRKRTMHTQGST